MPISGLRITWTPEGNALVHPPAFVERIEGSAEFTVMAPEFAPIEPVECCVSLEDQ